MPDLPRLYNTLRHLRPRQIAFQLYYRLTGKLLKNGARTRVRSRVGERGDLPPLSDALKPVVNALPVRLTEAGFRFLNRTVSFGPPAATDWNHADHGKLWTYNLNYFEFLRQPGLDPDHGEQLIAAWVTNEDTHRDGWEPYPTSLRLVNWLQFYRSHGRPVPAAVHGSLRRQYANLLGKIEYHLGGNHLLENALALALTACYLGDAPGRKKADNLLRAELKEQYLHSGGHYERSVMYHLILLWRQLDLLSWGDMPAELEASVRKQLAWAEYMITPDGRYPHFNDSVSGIAPAWSAVLAFATALGLSPASSILISPQDFQVWHWPSNVQQHPPSHITHHTSDIKPASNARAQRADNSGSISNIKRQTSNITAVGSSAAKYHSLWLNPTQISPPHLPGHAHADTLTFTLHAAGKPLLVDTAVSTYEKNTRRAHERSTVAHNTVTVGDDLNSSDVWGGFRVGRRATVTIVDAGPDRLTAYHDGFPATAHQRTFALDRASGRLTITDQLKGRYESGTARFHFAAECIPILSGNTLTVADCRFTFTGATGLALVPYQQATGWNQLADARCLEVTFANQLITEILPA